MVHVFGFHNLETAHVEIEVSYLVWMVKPATLIDRSFVQRKGLETTVLTGLQGGRMMMVLNATLANSEVPTHSHPHEQIGMVYSGKALLRIGNEEQVVSKGDFYRIPSNVPHSDVTIGDEPFIMLDVFCPLREDFIKNVKERARTQK